MTTPTGTRPSTTSTWKDAYNWPILYRYKQRSFQKKPFDLPLFYQAFYGSARRDIADPLQLLSSNHESASTVPNSKYSQPFMDLAANKAYEKLKGRIYDSAALGVDFAEYRQSLDMITRSVGTLVRFTSQVRKLRFGDAAKTLGQHFVPPGVSARKAWSSNWLEYHFGWEPLVHDIYDAMDVLNNPLKSVELCRGRGINYRRVDVVDENPTSAVWTYDGYDTYYLCQQGAQVRAITDRGLHSLDQFGLLNPATIAWELVPFSFVVDWFANVGQVLGSFSDFAGMTLEKTYTSYKYIVIWNGWCRYRPSYTGVRDRIPNTAYGTGVSVTRSVGLTAPVFSVKQLRLPSSVRALTALSLLGQRFK